MRPSTGAETSEFATSDLTQFDEMANPPNGRWRNAVRVDLNSRRSIAEM
jgi:hypothetical protein